MIPLRVALFIDSKRFAGTEQHMVDLALGLRHAGVQTLLACPSASPLAGRARDLGLPLLHIPRIGMPRLSALRALTANLKTGALDLVHAHNGRAALIAALAVRRAGRGCAMTTQHFLEPAYTLRRGWTAYLSRAAHHWVDGWMSHFIAVSQAARTAMLARGEGRSEEITVVSNGMPPADPATFASPAKIRVELGIGAEAPFIVCVARLEREKSLEVLIDAMKAVVAAEPAAVCVIAGRGAQKAALLARIAASGLGSSVRLIGFRSDALALMNAADLFVLPSPGEPFGLVLIEAMSVGKPVIATRAGGPLEIVAEGETGVLVEPGSSEEMGRAIIALIRAGDVRRRMGSAGHQRFLEEFTVERMTQSTIEAYGRALAAERSPAADPGRAARLSHLP